MMIHHSYHLAYHNQGQMEEFLEDHDYAITRLTIDYLASKGADPVLVDMLNKALADTEEITIIWKRS